MGPGLAALAFALLSLAGCSPAYVYQAWRGHHRLIAGQRPIEQVLADRETPDSLRDKLRLVEDVRAFAFDRMGLKRSRDYSGYVDVRGPAVSYAVSAARRTRFEAKTWWFPVIGRVPYKGYFKEAAAERERDRLERSGWDAIASEVPAYSTLGWSQDPVVSSMLEGGAGEIAETLIHELTHADTFFKGDADFDEALATYVGEAGASDFLAARFGPGSEELKEYRRDLEDESRASAAVDALYDELSAVYASTRPDAEKLAAREPIFARYRARLGLKTLNNAVVLAHRRYHYDLDDFRRARERLGGDWPRTLERFRTLDRRRPREDLERWLRQNG